MPRPTTPMKQTRTRHSLVYKDEALALAEGIGVSKAAEQLGLHVSQLYGWRSKKQQSQTSSEREQSLADENARLKRLLAEQAEELVIVKKAAAYFMRAQALLFPVKTICRVLGVARSGFYAWCSRKTSMRHQRRIELDRQVAQAYSARKGRSGAPRLCHDLRDAGLPCNRKIVAALMQR